MDLILPFNAPTYPFAVDHQSKIMLMGSCFTEEIGNKLRQLKFQVLQNPNGILFDPLSICDALNFYLDEQPFDETHLVFLEGIHHSWKHHSSCSKADKDDMLKSIESAAKAVRDYITKCDVLILSLGTAWYYQLKSDGKNVANCHKAPAALFNKQLLTTAEIVRVFNKITERLARINPRIKLIFTVSPVKHLRDGIVENNVSKARLLDAVYTITVQQPQVFYFPSFEIVNDVLRDYRFYKSDMAHPNEQAVQFIFDIFSQSFFSADCVMLLDRINQIIRAANHIPLNPEGEAHQRFVAKQLEILEAFNRQHPSLDFSRERNLLLSAKCR